MHRQDSLLGPRPERRADASNRPQQKGGLDCLLRLPHFLEKGVSIMPCPASVQGDARCLDALHVALQARIECLLGGNRRTTKAEQRSASFASASRNRRGFNHRMNRTHCSSYHFSFPGLTPRRRTASQYRSQKRLSSSGSPFDGTRMHSSLSMLDSSSAQPYLELREPHRNRPQPSSTISTAAAEYLFLSMRNDEANTPDRRELRAL